MISTDEQTCTQSYKLTCSGCGNPVIPEAIPTFSNCDACGASPIAIAYPEEKRRAKSDINHKDVSMWRYRQFLPVEKDEPIITLGEGWTPVLSLDKLAELLGTPRLLLKDESVNPTGSFKARGLSMAVTKAKNAGIITCIIPTAGNAGGAMSAYCAKAGLNAVVVMPSHTPEIFKKECEMYGAEVILVDGLISDCARRVSSIKMQRDCFDLSTMKEPFRLEGKKTLGYEIAEQFNWLLPDVILYPTGGGTGLIGIWKAFKEMQSNGWITGKLPRMIAVQAANCNPLVQTMAGKQKNATHYKGVATMANGLAVPNPFAEQWMLKAIKESRGTAISIEEGEIIANWKLIASLEGLLIAPEGAALIAAFKILLENNNIRREEKVLLLNTGSGYKYLENLPPY